MDNSDKNNSANVEQIKQIKKIFFWRTAFFGVVILAAGIIIGAASMFIFDSHSMAVTPAGQEFANLMPRLSRDLGLTQEQVNKIQPILNRHLQRLQRIREDARTDIADTLAQMNKEISPMLAENQKSVWQGELVRLQNNMTPPMRRGAGAQRRRGASEAPGPAGPRRFGARGQQGMGGRRGFGAQNLPGGPNSVYNDVNENRVREIPDTNSPAK